MKKKPLIGKGGNIFKQAKWIQEGLRKAEKQQRRLQAKIDRLLEGERVSGNAKRKHKREKLLDSIGWQCPKCKMYLLDSKRWVVKRKMALCKGCFSKYGNVDMRLHETRYMVTAREMRIARQSTGLTQELFAIECNWTRSYQYQLEARDTNLTEASISVIQDVIRKFRGLPLELMDSGN